MPFQLVLNGLQSTSSLQRLVNSGMDPGVLRPYAETDNWGRLTGRNVITIKRRNPYTNEVLTNEKGEIQYQSVYTNAPTTLRREDWLKIDKQVIRQAKKRLITWDIIHSACPYDIPNGMGTPAIQHAMADSQASATISMDPIRKGERSRPQVDTAIIPVPVIHSDNSMSARQIAISQGGSLPLDVENLNAATRVVAETVEQLLLGVTSSYSYGGGTIYGITNHPNRLTKSLTVPTGSNNATVINEVVQMTTALRDVFMYGPYLALYSNAYDQWLQLDYSTLYPGVTLLDRLKKITSINRWQNVDYLTGYQIVLIQLDADYIQAAQGMDITPVQWEEQGGFEQCFKVLCIQFPRIRANTNGNTAINHGVAA